MENGECRMGFGRWKWGGGVVVREDDRGGEGKMGLIRRERVCEGILCML